MIADRRGLRPGQKPGRTQMLWDGSKVILFGGTTSLSPNTQENDLCFCILTNVNTTTRTGRGLGTAQAAEWRGRFRRPAGDSRDLSGQRPECLPYVGRFCRQPVGQLQSAERHLALQPELKQLDAGDCG